MEWMHKAKEPGVMLPVSLLVSAYNDLPPTSPIRSDIIEYLRDYERQTVGKGLVGVVEALVITSEGELKYQNSIYEEHRLTKLLNRGAPDIHKELKKLAESLDKFSQREQLLQEHKTKSTKQKSNVERILPIASDVSTGASEIVSKIQVLKNLLSDADLSQKNIKSDDVPD